MPAVFSMSLNGKAQNVQVSPYWLEGKQKRLLEEVFEGRIDFQSRGEDGAPHPKYSKSGV